MENVKIEFGNPIDLGNGVQFTPVADHMQVVWSFNKVTCESNLEISRKD